MEIVILKQALRELRDAPRGLKEDIASLFEDLRAGKHLSLPISRPLPSIAKGLHELRLSSREGEYRVFYIIKIGSAVYVLHGTKKKTEKTDRQTIELLKLRIRSIDL